MRWQKPLYIKLAVAKIREANCLRASIPYIDSKKFFRMKLNCIAFFVRDGGNRVFTIFSKQFHMILSIENRRRSIVGQALRDLFHTAKSAAEDNVFPDQRERSRLDSTLDIELPDWLPKSQNFVPTANSERPVYITCRH